MSTSGRSPILAIILGLVKFGFKQKESVQKLNDPSAIKIVPQPKENKTIASILNFSKKESYNTPLPPILLSLIHSMIVTNMVQQQVQSHTAAKQTENMTRVAMLEAQKKSAEHSAFVR